MNYTLPEKITTHIDSFTGRTWLLPEIIQWYENTYDRLLIITGDPGSGKSMLGAWLAGSGPLPMDPTHRKKLVFLREQVKAAHFCQIESGTDQPTNLAKNLASQFVETLPGFDAEIQSILAERIIFAPAPVIKVGSVETGGVVKGVEINLRDLDDEMRFNRSVREPLKNLYNHGFSERILIIIDSLDEALGYSGEVKIPDLLAKLADLPYQIRFLATTRPDPRVLKRFFGVKIIDLVDDSPKNVTDIYDYILNYLPDSIIEPQRSNYSQRVSEASKGIFLYAQLALDDLGRQLESGPLPKKINFPNGLGGFYNRFLQRELGKKEDIWIRQFRPVLGVISVSQGDGLYRKHIERFTEQEVEQILFACQQYLDGTFPDGPFRVFHRSFAEFLLEGKDNQYFRIDASKMHEQIANYYYNLKDGSPPLSKWDEYALHFINIHLEGASRIDDEQQRHLQVERLVNLVLDPRFKQRFYKKVNDESLMLSNILLAVRAAAYDTHESAMELLLQALRRLQNHRHEHLQPGPVFEKAGKGDIDDALNRLALLPVEPQWQRATSLVVAWLGAKTNPKKAEEVLLRMESQPLRSIPENILCKRLRTVLNGEIPSLESLPPTPEPEVLDLMLMRLGGQKTGEGISGEIISGYDLHPNPQIMEVLGDLDPGTGDNVPVFLAQQDGPYLVSYAVKHPKDGLQKIQDYIEIHAANPYLYYRNASLWLLLEFLLRHPDDGWTIKSLESLLVTALNMEGVAYEEALVIMLLALQSKAGKTESFQELQNRRKFAQEQINNLQNNIRYQGDTWGVHKRRMCALAQAYHTLPNQEETVEELIDRAFDLPFGFAGFMFKAWLNLAETVRICEQENRHSIASILEEALKAAHNIQDSVFCARSTAIVNAMKERWWPLPDGLELEDLLEEFDRQPDAPQFTALHFVGEIYPHREDDPDKLPLQDVLLNANSLFEISDAFRLPIADLVSANAENGWDANKSLPIGTPVNVPVPFFTPLLATRFSAEIAVADWLEAHEKRALIQHLTLAAINDRQALDTLLSRLLLVASPDNLPMLIHMMEPAKQVYDQFPDLYTIKEVT